LISETQGKLSLENGRVLIMVSLTDTAHVRSATVARPSTASFMFVLICVCNDNILREKNLHLRIIVGKIL
jgi:hypothetical protein